MRSPAALTCLVALALLGAPAPARADSPSWRSASAAFETMKKERVPGVFWFHGDSLFHNSLSHKFHQPEVVALLRGFYCVQVPNEGGRSGPEQAIAQRFGIGHSMGSIVVCYWDGEELTRYGDIVETRHFVPILKSWHVANARRLRQTDKASDALGKARDLLERGDVKIAVLKLTQVLDKEGHISREVFGDAQGLRDRVLARLDGSLGEAAELRRRGLKDEARTRGEELLADYSRLPTAKQRIEDFLAGRWTAGAARAPAPAAPPAPTPAGPAPAGAPPAAAPQDPGGVRVRFSVQPGAGSRVELAGTMNDWQPSGAWALTDPDGDGRFEGEFELRPGRYLYKFVIDGQRWLQDPANPVGEDDGHQGQNSVLVVGPNGVEPAGQAPEADGAPQGAEGGFGSATRTRGKAFVGEIFFVEPGTESLPDFRGSSEGKIYAKSLNVAPRPFSDGFPGLTDRFEWFAIRYTGDFEATERGVYKFRLLADDAARLWIDGKLAIDNDGLHEPRSVSQKVRLKKGIHQLTIDYMQGPAMDVALQLFVQEPSASTEHPVEAATVPTR